MNENLGVRIRLFFILRSPQHSLHPHAPPPPFPPLSSVPSPSFFYPSVCLSFHQILLPVWYKSAFKRQLEKLKTDKTFFQFYSDVSVMTK